MNYALTIRVVRTFRVILMAALTIAAVLLAFRGREIWEVLTFVESAALAIFITQWATLRLQEWAEHRFSGETQHPERILSELGHAIAGIRDVRALVDIVVPRMADALHADPIGILIDCGNRYELCGGTRVVREPVVLEKKSGVVRHLQRLQSPAKINPADAQSWINGVTEAERSALAKLQARVLVPMIVDRRIVALLSVGPKRWDMPYSRTDLQFLTTAASQTGLALENARLNDDIRAEIAARERLNRELEIAREVQQGLFPQVLPKVDRLDFAGYCRPAYGVGGDYYDFIALNDHALGIAIGDVSGKGIGAALTMATLQASLRGQTIKQCETISETIRNVNKLVYEASSSSRYATFFYAEYEPETHRLRYVNAGHNAPMLYRRDGSEKGVRRLDEGGTVVGLFPEAPYEEAQVQVQPGDILIAFTDGVTEALNAIEQEFGEERLLEALRATDARSAADMISSMLALVDAFTAGAPQHDDITLVVVRVQ